MAKILSWNSSQELKDKTIAEMKEHIAADRLVKGQYWENGKGCAVGCLIQSGDHYLYEERFGIPKELAELEDSIFEGLPSDQAMDWPVKLLEAVPVGKDLSLVWSEFAIWLLINPDHGAIRFNSHHSIRDVATLHQRIVNGGVVTKDEWDAARDAARDAAGDAARDAARDAAGAARDAARDAGAAAWAAARDAAGDAARDAAWAAAGDAGDARDAGVAAWAAARAAARDAARAAQSARLISLLEACNDHI